MQVVYLHNKSTMNNTKHNSNYTKIYFIAFYLLFGLLHELSHVAIATVLLPNTSYNNHDTPISQSLLLDDSRSSTVVTFLARAILGRYCLITIANRNDNDDVNSSSHHIAIIQHFGWIFSTLLAITLHYCHRRFSSCRVVKESNHDDEQLSKASKLIGLTSSSIQPVVIIAAYTTAIEAISTDLFSFGVSVFNQVSLCSASVRYEIVCTDVHM